ncbi:MAG: hypothetical protein UR23_C0037G0014, partial [Candidatus Roizmanbacteria bacterium GW2011_GWA2_32_13]
MDSKNILAIINDLGINNISFKIVSVLFAIFYYFYALVIAKQVKIMDKALQDKYNRLILLITSLQVT